MVRHVLLRFVFASVATLVASVVLAAPCLTACAEDVEPAGYRALVDEALREYDAANYDESRALFVRAHELFPNARTHRGIAKAEFELRNYPASIGQLEAALGSSVRPLDARLRADTETLLARARQFVGYVVLETKPAASELRVDGIPLVAVSAEPVALRIGEHLLETQAPGYEAEKRQITVRGDQTQRLMIVFTRPLAALASAPQEAGRWYRNPWLWTGVGAIVAGVTAGGIVAATRDRHARYDGGSTASVLGTP